MANNISKDDVRNSNLTISVEADLYGGGLFGSKDSTTVHDMQKLADKIKRTVERALPSNAFISVSVKAEAHND